MICLHCKKHIHNCENCGKIIAGLAGTLFPAHLFWFEEPAHICSDCETTCKCGCENFLGVIELFKKLIDNDINQFYKIFIRRYNIQNNDGAMFKMLKNHFSNNDKINKMLILL